MENMIVKMGFIGFGKSVNCYYLFYVMIWEILEVKMIFDLYVNEKVVVFFKEKGVNFIIDFNELLMDLEIELVIICMFVYIYYDLVK